jgi:sugar O-acyltransferase (sialic acid O-acetyltransferase NeuD family)
MQLQKLAIFGAGGFGREVKMLIDQINSKEKKFDCIGFFDDDPNIPDQINGIPFIGGLESLNQVNSRLGIVISIGDPKLKFELVRKIKNPNLYFPNIIHPTVLIGEDVHLGEGVIICAGVVITVNIHIGNHVVLNLNSTIGHDCVVEDFSALMPAVNLSGGVNIKEGVYIGTGAQINNRLTIGPYAIIGSGAVVIKDLPGHCTAVGMPAKAIKFS